MKLSAPIYHLKRKAKRLSRDEDIPLHEALNRIAAHEGYANWSLLAARHVSAKPENTLLGRLRPGDLLLLGARPGQGKTLKSLELAVGSMKAGRRAYFFTLEYTTKDVIDRFPTVGAEYASFAELFEIDCSDAISAEYIIKRLAFAPRGSLVVVDYLQLLDQRRENPELGKQVLSLRAFAQVHGLIMVFISQIDRSYDASTNPFPDIDDIRLPNPLDLRLFDKMCFLNRGETRLQSVA